METAAIKSTCQTLAWELVKAIRTRLGNIWKQVSPTAAMWRPKERVSDDGDDPDPSYHEPRRVLLYHISTMLDINEFQLEFIDPHPLSRDAFDGWSAALGAPILGVTWHFIDDE